MKATACITREYGSIFLFLAVSVLIFVLRNKNILEIYIRRLQSIRRAVVRLLDRAPGTLVVIRIGNPKGSSLFQTSSDWFSLQCNKVLRAVFKGLKVHLIDAWEMVLAHHLPHNLHMFPDPDRSLCDWTSEPSYFISKFIDYFSKTFSLPTRQIRGLVSGPTLQTYYNYKLYDSVQP